MIRGILAIAVLVAGCAVGADRSGNMRIYDLGIEPPAARLSGLRPMTVRASAPFDTSDMLYRLAYREPAELLAFSQSRWAATPAILLQRRFAQASGGDPARCALEFELSELSQVFSAHDASVIVLEGRAVLVAGTSRVAERIVRVRESNAGGAAATGAHALARAADRMISEVSAWSAQIPACGTN